MHDLRSVVEKLAPGYAWKVEGDDIVVPSARDARTQRIHVSRAKGRYAFTTVVLGSVSVNRSEKRRRALAVHAWTRNAETELVNFTFDARARLIGEIQHPADHLDPEELELYVNLLAAEGDRFEYLLTGEDQY